LARRFGRIPFSFDLLHHADRQLLSIIDALQDELNIHHGLSGLPGALAIDAMLADQRKRVSQEVQRKGQPAALHTHLKLVPFQFIAPFVVDRHFLIPSYGPYPGTKR